MFSRKISAQSELTGLIGARVAVGDGYYNFAERPRLSAGVANFAQNTLHFALFDALGVHMNTFQSYNALSAKPTYTIVTQNLVPAATMGTPVGNFYLQPLSERPDETAVAV